MQSMEQHIMWKDFLLAGNSLLLTFAAISSFKSGETLKIIHGLFYLSVAVMCGVYFVIEVSR
jgi:hypothetical protein